MANSKLKCKCCGDYQLRELVVTSPFGRFCSKEHAIDYAVEHAGKQKAKRLAKIERDKKKEIAARNKNIRERKKQVRTPQTDKAKAQAQVNRYCRLRDRLAGINVCVCCDRPLNWDEPKTIDGGHFQDVGSKSSLRFNTWNIHAQAVYCNRHRGGDSGNYEQNLRKKIGNERVDFLINEKSSTVKKMSKQYLHRVEDIFKRRANKLQKKIDKGFV